MVDVVGCVVDALFGNLMFHATVKMSGWCWSSCVATYTAKEHAISKQSIGTCPQHPVVTLWAPRFSDFLFVRSLVCPRFSRFSLFFGALGKHMCASVVGHTRKQSAVWQSEHVCNGRLVRNSSDHERDHNHWSPGTQDPTVIPLARGKKKIATWTMLCVRGSGTKSRTNDFGTRKGHHGAKLWAWLQPLCMTLTKKVYLYTSGRFHRMDRLLLTGTSHLTCLSLPWR